MGLLIPLKTANPKRLAAVLARAADLAKDRDPAADEAAGRDGHRSHGLVGVGGTGPDDSASLKRRSRRPPRSSSTRPFSSRRSWAEAPARFCSRSRLARSSQLTSFLGRRVGDWRWG